MSDRDLHLAPARLGIRQLDGPLHRVGDGGVLDLQPNRPNEVEDFLHDRVGHLGFVDDVGQHRLRIGCVRNLSPQQTGHHLDSGERVLDLVRDDCRHLTDGRQPVAEPLALFQLLDARQVLEEHRRADHVVRCRRARTSRCSR